MKRLLSKVLLALITLSVAAPACAGVGPGMFKDLHKVIYGSTALGLIGGPVAGGLVALGLQKAYRSFYSQGKSSVRSKVMTFLGGAVAGGSVGIYWLNNSIVGDFLKRPLLNF